MIGESNVRSIAFAREEKLRKERAAQDLQEDIKTPVYDFIDSAKRNELNKQREEKERITRNRNLVRNLRLNKKK